MCVVFCAEPAKEEMMFTGDVLAQTPAGCLCGGKHAQSMVADTAVDALHSHWLLQDFRPR